MQRRKLGNTQLELPILSFGASSLGAEFRGVTLDEVFASVKVALELGIDFIDTSPFYGRGMSEVLLGVALKDVPRESYQICTKLGRFDLNHFDFSARRVAESVDISLHRLGCGHLDIVLCHDIEFVPLQQIVDETLPALRKQQQAGKVRYIGCSNFSGWHLMKSLAVCEKYGCAKHISHQAYYSLISREFEWELMPLALDQKIGTMVWSPLGWGRLTGKLRRGAPLPEVSRLHKTSEEGPPVEDEHLYKVVDAIDQIAAETGKSVAQISLNWLLQRPTVANIVIGARNEEQLKQNLLAVGWNLTPEQVAKLDAASDVQTIYPYWHQRQFQERNPLPV